MISSLTNRTGLNGRPHWRAILLTLWIAIAVSGSVMFTFPNQAASQELFLIKQFEVRKTQNVNYGFGTVNFTTTPSERALLLDIYEPTGVDVPALKPGFILVHGGGWRYGSKSSDRFENLSKPGDFNSSISDYAREFARRGYVCAVIDYRKIQDDPAVRGILSTPPSSISHLAENHGAIFTSGFPLEQVIRGMEAGFDDTVLAINWLVDNAATYGIDPSRIVVGGWSAGASNSLWAAYVEEVPVRAVWSNSGTMGGNHSLINKGSEPPAILFHGGNDTLNNVNESRNIVNQLANMGLSHQYFEMENEDHFFRLDKSLPPTDENIEDLMAEFFFKHLFENHTPPPPAPDLDIYRAVELVWAGEADQTYRLYRSVGDLEHFYPLGDPIVGHDGEVSVFDSVRHEEEVFYKLDVVAPAATTEEILSVHESFSAAVNGQDLEALSAQFHEDLLFEDVPQLIPMNHGEMKDWFQAVWGLFPDYADSEGVVLTGENIMIVEHTGTGTHLGDWDLGALGVVPATGVEVQIPHLGVFPAPELPPLEPSFVIPAPPTSSENLLTCQTEELTPLGSGNLLYFIRSE